ncbi:uncharacterized protein V6R79_010159 [Siganus canaliculatus]
MDKPNAVLDLDQLNHQVLPATEDRNRVDRVFRLPSCVTSRWASLTSLFFIGLESGAAGGLLLGTTAVIVLQSLELLAENRGLLDQLEKSLIQDRILERKLNESLSWENNGIRISIFAEIFGILTSSVSLFVGVFIGLSTYALVMEVKSEAVMENALAVAGSVCLTAVTATGCILGLTLETFLSFTLNINLLLWFFISLSPFLFPFIKGHWSRCIPHMLDQVIFQLLIIWSTSTVACITFRLSFFSKTRFTLVAVFIPFILAVKSYFLKLPVFIVPYLLNIYDIFYTAEWPVITLQSPAPINTSCVLEAIFVGVLTSLWWSVTVGLLLFEYWQRCGEGRICVTAAALGSAVLAVIKLSLPVLGPGPTIGSLMGVAAAAGVSLSAAGAAADQYGAAVGDYGFVGRMGVTVGAAAGAFLSSSGHSGLSGTFMALCTAVVPAGEFLKPKLGFI